MIISHMLTKFCLIFCSFFLQLASFSGNNIKSMEGINHPMLEKLFLACKSLCFSDAIIINNSLMNSM